MTIGASTFKALVESSVAQLAYSAAAKLVSLWSPVEQPATWWSWARGIVYDTPGEKPITAYFSGLIRSTVGSFAYTYFVKPLIEGAVTTLLRATCPQFWFVPVIRLFSSDYARGFDEWLCSCPWITHIGVGVSCWLAAYMAIVAVVDHTATTAHTTTPPAAARRSSSMR